jgi:hypothetical protein
MRYGWSTEALTILTKADIQLKAILKWSEKKPAEVVVTSTSIAWSTETLFELVRACRAGQVQTNLCSAPNVDEWLSLYTDNRRIKREIRGLLRSTGNHPQGISEFDNRTSSLSNKIKQYGDIESIPIELKNELKTHLSESKSGLMENHLQYLSKNIHGANQEDLPDDVMMSPTMIFILAVYFTSWLIYRQPPVILLRKARQGNIDDIENLLRLDPTALIDKKISAHFHNARFQKNQHRYGRILNSLNKQPKVKVTLAKMKMNMAGLISVQSESLGHRLNEPEIRALYDAFAKDKGFFDIDTDIPNSPEAFSRAINRERKFWFPIFPDKK